MPLHQAIVIRTQYENIDHNKHPLLRFYFKDDADVNVSYLIDAYLHSVGIK